jgi:hypothetical protein
VHAGCVLLCKISDSLNDPTVRRLRCWLSVKCPLTLRMIVEIFGFSDQLVFVSRRPACAYLENITVTRLLFNISAPAVLAALLQLDLQSGTSVVLLIPSWLSLIVVLSQLRIVTTMLIVAQPRKLYVAILVLAVVGTLCLLAHEFNSQADLALRRSPRFGCQVPPWLVNYTMDMSRRGQKSTFCLLWLFGSR